LRENKGLNVQGLIDGILGGKGPAQSTNQANATSKHPDKQPDRQPDKQPDKSPDIGHTRPEPITAPKAAVEPVPTPTIKPSTAEPVPKLSAERKSGRIIFEGQMGDATVIKSIVGDAPGRLGYEKILIPGVELNLKGWERAHSQGNITGAESAKGIRYAPPEVNQKLQKLGIEKYISEFNRMKANDVTIHLTTETRAHPGTLRLSSITYKVEASRPGFGPVRLFEAEITVSNNTVNPLISPSADHYGSIEDFLSPPNPRKDTKRFSEYGTNNAVKFTKNAKLAMKQFELSKKEFNTAIHDIKKSVERNPDMKFNLITGEVLDQRSDEVVGNLLDYQTGTPKAGRKRR